MIKKIFNHIKWKARKIKKRIRLAKFKYLRPTITQKQILNDLQKLGISKGDTVFVHSSLSKIGFVEKGPITVINALIDAIGSEGTLMLPAFSLVRTMLKTLQIGTVFDVRKTPATLGAIPETFRVKAGVVRSIHPTHSVCAFGKNAKWVVEGHEKCGTTFGKGSPLYKLLQLKGKILGLGVDLRIVTFYHVIEDVEETFPINPYYDETFKASVVNQKGELSVMEVKAHSPEVSRTRIYSPKGAAIHRYLTEYLRQHNLLTEGKIGYAPSWVILSKNLYDAQKKLMLQGITIYTTKEELKRLK